MRRLVVVQYWYTRAFGGNTLMEREVQVPCSVLSALPWLVLFASWKPWLMPRHTRFWVSRLIRRAIAHKERVLTSRLSVPNLCRADGSDATAITEEMRFVHNLSLALYDGGKQTFGLPTVPLATCSLTFRRRYVMGFAGEALRR